MTKTTKPPRTRKNGQPDASKGKRREYPTKADMERNYSFFEATGTMPEDWGDTEEERLRKIVPFIMSGGKVRK